MLDKNLMLLTREFKKKQKAVVPSQFLSSYIQRGGKRELTCDEHYYQLVIRMSLTLKTVTLFFLNRIYYIGWENLKDL